MLISRIGLSSLGQSPDSRRYLKKTIVKVNELFQYQFKVKTHLLQGNTATVVCAVKHFMVLTTPTLISQTSRERVAQFIISYHTITESKYIVYPLV